MKFVLDKGEMLTRARISSEIEIGGVTSEKEKYWYEYAIHNELAFAVANKMHFDEEAVLKDVKKIPIEYCDLVVSFVNNELHYQGKYWTFEEVYSIVENWQIRRYGEWGMFCKVVYYFHRMEMLLKEKDLSSKEIEEQKNQLIKNIQEIGMLM